MLKYVYSSSIYMRGFHFHQSIGSVNFGSVNVNFGYFIQLAYLCVNYS